MEIEELRRRLAAAEETLDAIQRGEVDGLVVTTPNGPRVYTLEGADEFYRTLIEQMSEGAAALGADGRVLYANAALARMVGGPLETVIGAPFRDLIQHSDHDRLDRLLVLDGIDRAEAHIQMVRPADEAPLQVGIRVQAVRRAGGPRTICLIVFDRTLDIAAERSRRDAEVVTERERVARDLHDTVIQSLFAMGLRIEALKRSVSAATAGELDTIVAEIDQIIREVRQAIFDLRPPTMIADITESITRIASAAEHNLGYAAELAIDGDLSRVPPEAVGDLLASLRESLSNAARHAQATRVRVEVVVSEASLTLTVDDNGRGLTAERIESGMQNLRVRAEAHRGTFTAHSGRERAGTAVRWQIPLTAMP